jgi:Sodium/calcium exchanger protein
MSPTSLPKVYLAVVVTPCPPDALTELVIAAAALHAGEYALVKGSIAGAIVTNTLFMLGASFFLVGLKHHIQEYNRATARLDAALLFLAAIALVSPSVIAKADLVPGAALTQKLSVALSPLAPSGASAAGHQTNRAADMAAAREVLKNYRCNLVGRATSAA